MHVDFYIIRASARICTEVFCNFCFLSMRSSPYFRKFMSLSQVDIKTLLNGNWLIWLFVAKSLYRIYALSILSTGGETYTA